MLMTVNNRISRQARARRPAGLTTKLEPRLYKNPRTSITLTPPVQEMAQARMEVRGFNGNFSAYVHDLIRRDYEMHTHC